MAGKSRGTALTIFALLYVLLARAIIRSLRSAELA